MFGGIVITSVLSILLLRLIFVKRYRFFYFSTSFIFLRLWITILAAVIYASDRIWMFELGCYSEYSKGIIIVLLLLSIFLLVYEWLFSVILNKGMKISFLEMKKYYLPFYIKYLMLIVFTFFCISFFLFKEAYSTGFIGSIIGMSKFNFVDYVEHPFIFRVLYAINPLFVLIIAYGFIIQLKNNGIRILIFNRTLFYLFIFLGFVFHGLVFGIIQAKSHFVLTYIMFFIVPILYYSNIYDIKIFKNIKYLLLFSMILALFVFVIFYMHYGNLFLELLKKRLLLEGQFLFITIRDMLDCENLMFFAQSIPKSGENSAIVQLMENYLSHDKLEMYKKTGWTMSGAMPGFNFLFYDFWNGLFVWFLNIIAMSFIFLKSLKKFIKGNIVESFLYIKLYWYIVGYITLGENYFYRNMFWMFLSALLILYLVKFLIKHRCSFNYERNRSLHV